MKSTQDTTPNAKRRDGHEEDQALKGQHLTAQCAIIELLNDILACGGNGPRNIIGSGAKVCAGFGLGFHWPHPSAVEQWG